MTSSDVFCIKIRSRVYEWPYWRTQKNEEKPSHPKCTAKSCIWGAETPEPIATKFCMPGAVQDVITPANFWWRSVKGFWCGEGSNFGLFHWLASSPLKHSRTAVRVCDHVLLYMPKRNIFLKISRRYQPINLIIIFLARYSLIMLKLDVKSQPTNYPPT